MKRAPVVLALAFSGVAFATPATTRLTLPSGKALTVEVMAKDEDRGLLFVFDQPAFHGFWMKNCRFPIDIVWLDEESRVVDLAERVPPCKADPCPSYQPLRRALYVVEMGAGQARREKTLVGSKLNFQLPP